MHQIKCAGILGWKMFAQLISRHCPDFVFFVAFLYCCFQCNFALFFLQAETPRAVQQHTFYESLKMPAGGATFQCLDRRQEELCPPFFKIYAAYLNQNYIYIYKYIYILFYLFYVCFIHYFVLDTLKNVCVYFHFLCLFLLFNLFFIVFYYHVFPLFFTVIYCFVSYLLLLLFLK